MKAQNIKMNKHIIHLKIRRLDRPISDSDKMVTMEIEPDITYMSFKHKLMELLNISSPDDKILKIRNCEGILIPVTNLINISDTKKFAVIDITKIHQDVPAISCDSPLNSVYIDAVKSKLRNMESRVSRVEAVIPQLQWRRQSLVEHTTHNLGSRIAFLDRRIDELVPPEWNDHIKKSMC